MSHVSGLIRSAARRCRRRLAGSSGRWPAGFLGFLALVVGFEGFVAGHDRTLRHPWGWDWFLADRAARKKVGDCGVLCFGDSLMKYGVSPQVVEREAGLKAYNLAVGGGHVSGSYFLLRRAIESGRRPASVVLNTVPHGMAGVPSEASAIWPELLDYRDCAELSWRARDPHFFASIATAKLLPSVRYRSGIRAAVTASLKGESTEMARGVLLADLRNWSVNRAAQMSGRDPSARTDDASAIAPMVFPGSWRPNPLHVRYLDEFFDLAKSKNIRAYWLVAPFAPAVQARREAMGRDSEYTAFIHEVQARHPEVVVLDARHSGYGDLEHVNPIHLDLRGAATLSHDLAAILRRAPSKGPRWETMPAFREVPPGLALEDVARSSVAVAGSKLVK